MASETAQEARELVSAGRKNLIINGDMRITQRGTTTVSVGASASSGYLIHDRWIINNPGIDTLTANYSNENGDSSIGFRNSARLTCTGTETVVTGERFSFETRIEAKDIIFLRWGTSQAKPITISFWVKSNLPGKYGVHIRHHDPVYAFVFPYYVNVADTWEYKTYTIPGNTAGTTNNDTGIGFWIRFMLASGDVASSADEKWSAADTGPNNTPGAVAWGTSIGHTWEITGVQVEVGKNATEFEHRSYGEELALCQRYYQQLKATYGVASTTTALNCLAQLLHEMRGVPTLGKTSGSFNFGDMISASFSSSSSPVIDSIYLNNNQCVLFSIAGFTGLTAERIYRHEPVTAFPAVLTLSAEL
jgi:hypothetical protein